MCENADKEIINLWEKQTGLQELKEFGKSPLSSTVEMTGKKSKKI